MNALLPEVAPSEVTEQIRLKFDQAINPAKYGISLNDEAKQFLTLVAQNFVRKTEVGFATMLATIGMGEEARIRAGLYDFDAWLKKTAGVPYASAVNQASGNNVAWGLSPNTYWDWRAAIDRQYGRATQIDATVTAGSTTTIPPPPLVGVITVPSVVPSPSPAPPSGKPVVIGDMTHATDTVTTNATDAILPPGVSVLPPSAPLEELRALLREGERLTPSVAGTASFTISALLWLLKQELAKAEATQTALAKLGVDREASGS